MKGKGYMISKLKNSIKRVTSKANEMIRIIKTFYTNLYQSKTSNREARRGLLNNMRMKVRNDEVGTLEYPIDSASIVRAILRGKLSRALDKDDIPYN